MPMFQCSTGYIPSLFMNYIFIVSLLNLYCITTN